MFLDSIIETIRKTEVDESDSSIIAKERTVIGWVLNWVRLIGTGVALIMLTYMSLRYISASPARRGELKKSFMEFAIGAVVFIGASNIIYYLTELVTNVLSKIGNV